MTIIEINKSNIKLAQAKLRSFDNYKRQQILEILSKKGEMTVTDLFIKMRLEQSIVSQSLSIMRNSKIVSTRRDGLNIYYSLNIDEIEKINKAIKKFSNG